MSSNGAVSSSGCTQRGDRCRRNLAVRSGIAECPLITPSRALPALVAKASARGGRCPFLEDVPVRSEARCFRASRRGRSDRDSQPRRSIAGRPLPQYCSNNAVRSARWAIRGMGGAMVSAAAQPGWGTATKHRARRRPPSNQTPMDERLQGKLGALTAVACELHHRSIKKCG